eukprot:Rmarinus@m.29107
MKTFSTAILASLVAYARAFGGSPIGEGDGGVCIAAGDKIVNGIEATPGEFPFQVALTSMGYQFCGGSLISPRHVLTAAHCTDGQGPSDMQVAVGAHRQDQSDGRAINVANIIQNSEYDSSTFHGDFSILELAEDVTDYDAISYLDAGMLDGVGECATVSGWGTLSSGGSQPETLQKVGVYIISNDDCNGYYFGGIDETMLCAWDQAPAGNQDSCQGDSGGPMFVETDMGYVQIGVVSWGYGCADSSYPGVYARVSNFADWITEHIDM